ncbi:MAG: 5-methylcytosine-specific restriction enzyme [Acidimicrobiaceae bacterium]
MTLLDDARRVAPAPPRTKRAALSDAPLQQLCEAAGLFVPTKVTGALVAALRAGKNVVLTGPPGTGKSTLAGLVAELGRTALLCSGHLAATATSAWTVADTVGQTIDTGNGPTFRPGVVVDAIETGRWLVIDELNRADLDGAFGELFSLLAGQAVVLPHRRTEFSAYLSLVPWQAEVPEPSEPICVPKSWRIIATMNTTDRGHLFGLSRALMRRFAFVHVGSPDADVFERIVGGPGSVIAPLCAIRSLQDLGPAIYCDAADLAAARLDDGATESAALLDAFTAYVLPQLDPLPVEGIAELLAILDGALRAPERRAARRLLAEFGISGA